MAQERETEKSINKSAFGEIMSTRKKSDIRVYFRDAIPDSILKVATKINNVVTFYESAVDASAYVSIVNGELVVKAPPGLGDETIVFTKEHSVFHPNNGKRVSFSMFYDTWDTGDHEVGFCNFSETDLSFDDAITFRLLAGKAYGRIFTGGTERPWLDIDGNVVSNEIPERNLAPLGIAWNKGHLFDIQAQLRNVGNVFYFLSGKTIDGPKEVFKYYGLNNQDHVTTENAAQHGIYVVRNNGVQSQLRSGCMDISNETEDENIYKPVVLENEFDTTCQTTGTVLMAIFVPFSFAGKLNTRDSKYFKATIYTSRRGRVKIYKSPAPTYLTKTVAAVPGQPLVNSLVADGGDWSPIDKSSLWYIDNSQSGGAPRLITGFDETNSEKIDGGGGGTSSPDVPATFSMTFPEPKELPQKATHGEIYVVEGYGIGVTVSMRIETIFIGEGV